MRVASLFTLIELQARSAPISRDPLTLLQIPLHSHRTALPSLTIPARIQIGLQEDVQRRQASPKGMSRAHRMIAAEVDAARRRVREAHTHGLTGSALADASFAQVSTR